MGTTRSALHDRRHPVRLLLGGVSTLLCLVAGGAFAQAPARPPASPPRGVAIRLEGVFKADFDGLVERRVVRVAVPYSRTLYFNDKGRERGLSADFVRDFERYINEKYKKRLGKRPITVVMRPTTRDVLLQNVDEGFADIAVGNLTVTEERLKLVDFVAPEGVKPVSELVITGPKSPPITTADDLSGTIRPRPPRVELLREPVGLNERLKQQGKAPATLVLVPDALEDEDMMEMLNTGLFDAIVVDDWKARMWAQVLPKITINDDAAVREGGRIGWAIRKNSPKLSAELNEFYIDFVKKQGVYQARMKSYYRRIKQMNDPTAASETKRFEDTLQLFQKYGQQYHFDPLMLAAQGFQESKLDQSARSHVGAIGIMQVMPATGKELKVGDIRLAEANVHAGAKYMDQLMARYLNGAHFDDANRTLFAFACYNAGPGNISRMRKEAEKRGLDSEQWLNNVELVTAEKIGSETTTYVRNIYKYYVAYRLMLDVREAQEKARSAVKPGG